MARKSRAGTTKSAVSANQIERSIVVVRGQRVMLDADLARLYRVSTKALNQAVKRNLNRFPPDFAFRMTRPEFNNLKSQDVTSSWGGRRTLPWAFTEHGVAMLSSVLRSPMAARVNIEIMRAFIRLRRLLATPGELAQQIAILAQTVDLHDDQIKALINALKQMMAEPPKLREIGFHALRHEKK
ncbi:MAG: ORF6N domain-containing protein [Pirellulales bacterium]